MSRNEYIIENVNATMAMENMPLTSDDRKLLSDCLEGRMTCQEAVERLIRQYKKQPAVVQ